jgi:polysaccharide deacetylase family protein (PEP-CTERM system associated)
MTAALVRNIMTLDVEDYMDADPWRARPATFPVSARVEEETRHVLDLLDELGVTATCFVVGRVADALPRLVRELAARGHEIATHGYDHVRMQFLSPAAFREDLKRAAGALEGLTGRPVRGFRAPGFSLRSEHAWAFDVMAELGIVYDSSVRLVWPGDTESGEALRARAAAAGIREVPGYKLGLGRLAAPLAGGGGLRVLPQALTLWAIRRLNERGIPVPIYLHPYDMAVDRPSGPWRRTTPWGRAAMVLAHALQRTGRRRVAVHLRRVVGLSGVMTMEEFVSQVPMQAAVPHGAPVIR